MRFTSTFAGVLALMALSACGSVAQGIAWKAPTDIRGDADISHAGTLVDALLAYGGANFQGSGHPASDITSGDTTFHAPRKAGDAYGDGTISFAGGAPLQFVNGNDRAQPDAASFYNALPSGKGVSADYSEVVSNVAYFKGGPVGAITFSRLTPGHLYQVQLWALVQTHWRTVDDFTDSLGNTASLDAMAHVPKAGPLTAGQPYGQTVLGLFRAAGPTASIDWGAGDGTPYPAFSALALRDVTSVPGAAEAVAAIKAPGPVQPRHDVPGFPGIDVWKGITYTRVGRHNLKLDLFIPRDAPRPVPLVVYIHGGGWGGLDRTEGFANNLPQHGFALATVDYRLSGEAPYPAQIEDCKAAIRWLRVHAADYGYGADKIGAIGDSAGGNLVALLGVTAGNPALEADEGNPGVSSRVQAVADYFGPTDIIALDRHEKQGFIAQFLGGPVDEKQALARQASPLFLVTADASPFLIVHGDSDKVVPIQQSIDFYHALQKAGVPVQFYTMPHAGHGANNAQATQLVVALFDKYLH